MTSIFLIDQLPTTEAIVEQPVTVSLTREDLAALYLFHDRLLKWAKARKVQNVSFIKASTPLRKEVQFALTAADRNKRITTALVTFQHPVHKELAEKACVTYKSIIEQICSHPRTRHLVGIKDEFDKPFKALENLKNELRQCKS